MVIEMNPRVSRSSALASKATGFPIAKIAAKLAVGYTLDEIPNDITRETPASFEPTIDYVVVKIPRWAFEKFPGANPTLGTQMKSVGEAMAIGRTFKEALQKGLRSLEIDVSGLARSDLDDERLARAADRRSRAHLLRPARARPGMSVERGRGMTGIDPWFLDEIQQLVNLEEKLVADLDPELVALASQAGSGSDVRHSAGNRPKLPASRFTPGSEAGGSGGRGAAPPCSKKPSDGLLRRAAGADRRHVRAELRAARQAAGIVPVYNRVDTCAAEFEAYTPYLYSTYETECEAEPDATEEGHDPGRRAEPHRAGHRVRLLLLPRRLCPSRDGHPRRSWSTATRRRSRPTTTPRTGSTSSR